VDISRRDLTPARSAAAAPSAAGPSGTGTADGPEHPDREGRVDVGAVVLEEVARVGVFPPGGVTTRSVLEDDLGFDSLMLHDLLAGIRKRLPDTDIPAEDVHSSGITVQQLIALADPGAAGDPLPRPAPSREPAREAEAEADPAGWDPASGRVTDFPELRAFERRLDWLHGSGADNPYFRVHEGTVGNTTRVGDRAYRSFGSYNYLGLSGHPEVNRAAREAVDRYGTSVSASRPLAGERELTVRLEQALADFLGTEDCLVLVSGHATNVTAVGHLVGSEDLIVHDALAHDSILQGCRLSGAARRPFAHNDLDQLEEILRRNRSRFRRTLIAVEGAYSMDGDLVELDRVIELKERYGALLLVDEAHSIGTVGAHGRGVGEFFGVDRSGVDLWMGTLSKAFASCGGYLGGSARLIAWLRHTLPGFVYSVGMTPANAAAALAATELIAAEPHRVRALRRNAERFLDLAGAAGLPTGSSRHTPIIPCVLGDSERTLRLADRLAARGVLVDPIFHPAVEEGLSRLRFFVTSEHTEDEIAETVAALTEELEATGTPA
ncbi:aminotransferase class I/II-fold pyridoxal phosphate-dependent enzyme, partial [Streptomyces boncukensis]